VDVTANGLRFHVEESGEGSAVLLLHGFPDTGEVWRLQVPALATAGFRTFVPDLRGRGRSDRPEAVEAYALSELVADVTGILDALGIERAHVVGHDWGAVLAWAVAALAPERDDRLVVMSVGFPGAVRPNLQALEKGWYRPLFLFPEAEEVLSDNAYLLRTLLAGAPDEDRYLALLEDRSAPRPLRRGGPLPGRRRDARLRAFRDRRLALRAPRWGGPLAPARTARPREPGCSSNSWPDDVALAWASVAERPLSNRSQLAATPICSRSAFVRASRAVTNRSEGGTLSASHSEAVCAL
jgi:pimeloyl-ACP methyl ester carboxylesterase